jgi:hypothetical protein
MATDLETYACSPALSLAVFCVVMKRELVRRMFVGHFNYKFYYVLFNMSFIYIQWNFINMPLRVEAG